MKDLAARARGRKLKPQEYQGGSHLGVEPRHVRHQGLRRGDQPAARVDPGGRRRRGARRRRARARSTVATMMSVTLSCDHRAVDGALGAELLGGVQEADRKSRDDAGVIVSRAGRCSEVRINGDTVSTSSSSAPAPAATSPRSARRSSASRPPSSSASYLGGICLNWGCIPTKALLRSAEIYHYMQHAKDYGLSAEKVTFDPKAVDQALARRRPSGSTTASASCSRRTRSR